VSQRALLLVAGALALLSLGLPWGNMPGVPGGVHPGGTTVVVNADGSIDLRFDPSAYVPGLAGHTVAGAGHAMRVTGAAGALLVFAGVRRTRRTLVVAGLAVAALALPIGLSAGAGSGRTVYGLAIAIAALTLLRRPSPSTST
jgi:hypothetical protein